MMTGIYLHDDPDLPAWWQIYLHGDQDLPAWWSRFTCVMTEIYLPAWWPRFTCMVTDIYLHDDRDLPAWWLGFTSIMTEIYLHGDRDLPARWLRFTSMMTGIYLHGYWKVILCFWWKENIDSFLSKWLIAGRRLSNLNYMQLKPATITQPSSLAIRLYHSNTTLVTSNETLPQ